MHAGDPLTCNLPSEKVLSSVVEENSTPDVNATLNKASPMEGFQDDDPDYQDISEIVEVESP
jgi:hypothetical protein